MFSRFQNVLYELEFRLHNYRAKYHAIQIQKCITIISVRF